MSERIAHSPDAVAYFNSTEVGKRGIPYAWYEKDICEAYDAGRTCVPAQPFPKVFLRDHLRDIVFADELEPRLLMESMQRQMVKAWSTLPPLPEWAEYVMTSEEVDEGDMIAYYTTYTPRIRGLTYDE